MPRASIVQPDRGAVGAEQPVGAVHNVSRPADSVVDETSREKAWSSSLQLDLQIGLAARVRAIERERERMADRGRLAQLLRATAACRTR